MYAGHFAVAALLKARHPEVPATAIVGGAIVMDLAYALLLLCGVDAITPDLQAGPYLFFRLDRIDWDHSLLMTALLALAWGALWWPRGARASIVAAAALASHFALDAIVHNHDLALYPGAAQHLGLGLWGRWGTGAWWLEGLGTAACLAGFWTAARQRGAQAGQLWPVLLLVSALFIGLSPWTSPMHAVARLPMPAAQALHAGVLLLGFLVPATVMVRLLCALPVQAWRSSSAIRSG